jgi:hypothetical protein
MLLAAGEDSNSSMKRIRELRSAQLPKEGRSLQRMITILLILGVTHI